MVEATYILSVQYSCAVVSVFWLWREIVLAMRFLQKIVIGLLYYDPLAYVYILQDLKLFYSVSFYSVSFYSVSFSCTAQIHKLKFKSEYYLEKICEIVSKCKHRQSHYDFLYTVSKRNIFLGFFILQKQLASQGMFLMRSELSITAYFFLALYVYTALQSRSFLKNIKNFLCK